MLDSEGFVKAGWVHNLRLHQFKTGCSVKFVLMAKVQQLWKYCIMNTTLYRLNIPKECRQHLFFLGSFLTVMEESWQLILPAWLGKVIANIFLSMLLCEVSFTG